MNHRKALWAAVAVFWGLAAHAGAAQPDVITDLAGRTIRVPAKVERILLGEGRMIPALAIVERDKLSERLVGMPGDMEQLEPAGYEQYARKFPHLRELPRTGRTTAESFSVEKAISLKPDLAIFGLEGHGPSHNDRETLARLSAAGITVVFVDFRKEPLKNTVPSMTLLGRVLGRDREAAAFVAEYQRQMARVTTRLARRKTQGPSVFLENRVGLGDECCPTMTNGLMGRMLDAAGGQNIARELVPGAFGTLSLEYLIAHPPDVYIGTAIGTLESETRMPMRIVLGAGVDPARAQASLARALQRRGISSLPAVRAGRAHAIWHHFYSSPFNVVAVQVFAKWLHPELFADLDPRQTLSMFYEKFQPVALDGEYWTSLAAREGAPR